MSQHILVAYDGTPASDRAFSEALDIASRDSASLHARTVLMPIIEPPNIPADRNREAVVEWRPLLEQQAQAKGVSFDFEAVYGLSPPETLAKEATKVGANLIVMGHRQRQLWQRWMEISMAKRVLDHAPCRVLVVP